MSPFSYPPAGKRTDTNSDPRAILAASPFPRPAPLFRSVPLLTPVTFISALIGLANILPNPIIPGPTSIPVSHVITSTVFIHTILTERIQIELNTASFPGDSITDRITPCIDKIDDTRPHEACAIGKHQLHLPLFRIWELSNPCLVYEASAMKN